MKFKFIFCLTIFTSAAFGSVPANINTFINNLNKDASIQQQQNDIALRNFNTSIKSLTDKKSAEPVNNITLALQASKMNGSVPSVNCNGENDEYNYPSNYVYNENGQKVYRLHPFAKCIVTAPTEQQPVTTVTTQPDKTTDKKDTTTQWNINY
jgi:hypothetical protein